MVGSVRLGMDREIDMGAVERRIAQFETMVRPEADPTNDMAWFSLGGAYSDAGRHTDAAKAYGQCVVINPGFSKAYQMQGKALIDAGDRAGAAAVLFEGYRVAAGKGDRMPQKAMGEMLTQLGTALPDVKKPEVNGGGGDVSPGATMMDRKTGRPGTRLARPPMRGALGAWIQNNITAETWDAWIRQGTKVINEMRLDLSKEADGEIYDRHMYEYLGIDDEMLAELRGP
jgi:Fe-S cluster biosynthesis and repair protein YggX